MSRKRTIDAFFGAPQAKKPRNSSEEEEEAHTEIQKHSTHPTYPFPIPELPAGLSAALARAPEPVPGAGRVIDDRPDLDLLYFEPYVPRAAAGDLFRFLRAALPFYRVEYDIRRGGSGTHIRTPRWTTVFGVDATSRFTADGHVVDAQSSATAPGRAAHKPGNYKHAPRPIPRCLDELRQSAEAATGCAFNFCLVNYYASGADSIAYHSDDERFLGPRPAIASFSLGATRDFLLKHKPVSVSATAGGAAAEAAAAAAATDKPLKLPLASGDMVLMRGATQANWLHAIPKRSGRNEHDGGRINITFRRALVRGGTENYYNYNVGTGPVYRWDAVNREMRQWKPPAGHQETDSGGVA